MDIAIGLLNKGLTEMIKSSAVKVKDVPQKGPDFEEMSKKIHADTKKAKS